MWHFFHAGSDSEWLACTRVRKKRLAPTSQMCDTFPMQTATMSDLRYDFGKIEAWLNMGEEVVVTKHSRPVARVISETVNGTARPKKSQRPDYAARLKAMFGDEILPSIVLEEREASRW